MKEIYGYFIAAYRRGYFDHYERDAAIFELGQNDYRNFPVLKPFSLVAINIIETRTGEFIFGIELI